MTNYMKEVSVLKKKSNLSRLLGYAGATGG